MKRTDAGEVGFKLNLMPSIAGTCSDPEYYFRWLPIRESLYKSDSYEMSIEGGVDDFTWSVVGSGFSLGSAITSVRTNTINTDATVSTGSSAVVTVTDSCGNSVGGIVKVCYNEEAPITIYDEWSVCTDVLSSYYWGRLDSVVQIGDLFYFGVSNGGYWNLYSWDGESRTLTGIITGESYNPETRLLLNVIGNTLYAITATPDNLVSWTVGDANWTLQAGLGKGTLGVHEGVLWKMRRVTNPGALYKLEAGVWVEKAEYLDDRDVDNVGGSYGFSNCSQLVSLNGDIYSYGSSYYMLGGYAHIMNNIKKYVLGDLEADPPIPHDMKVCLTESENGSVQFGFGIEKGGYTYGVAHNGRLYRGITNVESYPKVDLIADAPTFGGTRYKLIQHGNYVFGLDSDLGLFRWSDSIGAWATSALGDAEQRHDIPFIINGRLHAAKSMWDGQKFCLVRWGV